MVQSIRKRSYLIKIFSRFFNSIKLCSLLICGKPCHFYSSKQPFLQKITDAYQRDRKLANLLLDPYFRSQINKSQANWRKVVALAAQAGVPCPAFMSALSYYDSYRSSRLPANLLQAQRDYFGAHTYERTDRPRGEFFHVDWPEPGRPQLKV